MKRQRRRLCSRARRFAGAAILTMATIFGTPTVALCQSKDAPAEVKKLHHEGEELAKQGKSNEAIAKYDEAFAKFSVPQYLVFAGEEYEKQKKLISARARYRKAASLALFPDALEKYKKARLTAADKLAAVEKLIPIVEVAVTGPSLADLELRVDDGDLEIKPSTKPGVIHLEVNPGARRIDLAAKGYVAAQCLFSVAVRSPVSEEPPRCARTMTLVPSETHGSPAPTVSPPSGDAAAAQALFDEGKSLMTQRRYAEACPKFEESQKLDPGLGTRMNLALCHEAAGRNATAWALYLEVAAQAKATAQTERAEKARAAARALEPRLSKVIIVVPNPPPGLEIHRDGVVVRQAQWGVPIPVDPGDTRIVAMVSGRRVSETVVHLEVPGETTVTVRPHGSGVIVSSGSSAPGFEPVDEPVGARPASRRVNKLAFGLGIATIAVGGATTLFGGVFGNLLCFECDRTGPNIALTIGALTAGGGIAMVIYGGRKVPVAPQPVAYRSTSAPTVALQWTGTGIGLTGAF